MYVTACDLLCVAPFEGWVLLVVQEKQHYAPWRPNETAWKFGKMVAIFFNQTQRFVFILL